ncbi:hypothetical protein [Halorussus lipolyticus]|uniref:hypothetical protein n=1 Tax=Halorussus lipolyticus TaxID=3034024 RepID=UPI0023E7BD61|nr:hypothetical protein [Halorussus sp. DT80]
MPSITRRRLLGSLAVGGTASLAGYRFLPAKFVPAPILEQRTKWRSIPEVDSSLPVADDALAESRQHLRETIDRAEEAWAEVDESDVDSEAEDFDMSLENSVEVARDQLAEAEGADPTTDALRTLRFGLGRAAWSLAAAKAISEDYEMDALREESRVLREKIDDFVASSSYEVADPRRGLAYCYRTERKVVFARLNADNVPDEEADRSLHDQNVVVEAIRSLIEGERWLGDAKAVYRSHRSNLDAGTESTDLESHLDRTWRDLAERIDTLLPDRQKAVERYYPDGEGPHERAVRELFNNGYSTATDAHPPSFGNRTGLLAFVAVEHAMALQHARGFQSAMADVDREFAEGSVGMPLVARTKQEATGKLRDLLSDSDDPITRELADRPREEIAIGDWSLGANPTFESEHPYAEAYAMYSLASANLATTPTVRDLLLP